MHTRPLLAVALIISAGSWIGCAAKSGSGLQPKPGSAFGSRQNRTPKSGMLSDPKYQKLVDELSGNNATHSTMPTSSSSATSMTGKFKKATSAVVAKFTPKPRVIPAADPISLASKPDKINTDVYYAAARMAESSGHMDRAIAQYQRALEVDPNHLPSLISLARLHDRQNKFDQAVELYRKTIKIAPDNAMAHNDLGLCFARQNRNDQAIVELRAASAIEPNRKLYRNNLATVLVEMGRADDAWRELTNVHSPAVAHYNLGYLLQRKGNKEQARRQFALACEADPSLKVAQSTLNQLNAELGNRAPALARVRRRVDDDAALQPPRSAPSIQTPRQLRRTPPTGRSAPAVKLRAPEPVTLQPVPGGAIRSATTGESRPILRFPVRATSGQVVEPTESQPLPTPDQIGAVLLRSEAS